MHPGLAERTDIHFRRSASDNEPAMVVELGPREAVIPVRDLYRAFAIDADSADGRMLALIAEALSFVSSLRCGELLPSELRTGEASWQPEPRHASLAEARLRLRLAALFAPPGGQRALAGTEALRRHADDPDVRRAVQRAFTHVAAELGLAGATEVVELVAVAAQELAFIEALRERLLVPVSALRGRLGALLLAFRGDVTHREMLSRTHLLSGLAEQEIATQFHEIDGQTADTVSFLRNLAQHRGVIRASRDRLYRFLRYFDTMIAAWAAAEAVADERLWVLVLHTYRGLAPRYMPRQEWPSIGQAGRSRSRNRKPKPKPVATMTW